MSGEEGMEKGLSGVDSDEEFERLERLHRKRERKRRAAAEALAAASADSDDSRRAAKVRDRLRQAASSKPPSSSKAAEADESDDAQPPKEKKKPAAPAPEEEDSDSDSTQPPPKNAKKEKKRDDSEDEEVAESPEDLLHLLDGLEQDPAPKGLHITVTQGGPAGLASSVQWAKNHFASHPQDDLLLKIGVESRPIHIIWGVKKVFMYLPQIMAIDTGDVKPEILRKLNFAVDGFQAPKPTKASPDHPVLGQHKATLTISDVEALRKLGPALVQKGKHCIKTKDYHRKFLSLGEIPERTAQPGEEDNDQIVVDLAPSRVLYYLDDSGHFLFNFSRSSIVSNGSATDGGTTTNARNQYTIRLEEFEKLLGFLDVIIDETARMASSRVAVNQPLTEALREQYDGRVLKYLTEKAKTEKVKADDPKGIFEFLAASVRVPSTFVFRGKASCTNRGSKENFQAYHMELCRKEKLEAWVTKIRRAVRSAHQSLH